MASEALIKAIDQQDALDQASETIQPLVTNAFKSAGPAGREVKNFLHGTWLGHPLHPVLTDVPIGAWTAALALDAAAQGDPGMRRAATLAMGVGLAGAVGAA